MSNAVTLYDLIAKIGANAVDVTQPMSIYTGRVMSTEPLSIQIDQFTILESEFLILTNAVRDHMVDIDVGWTTELAGKHSHDGQISGDTEDPEHYHQIQGCKAIKIYNGLKDGEEVILVRAQGGQSFIVLDRITPYKWEGEYYE